VSADPLESTRLRAGGALRCGVFVASVLVSSALAPRDSAAAGASDPAPLIYVEPQRSRTFGPQRVVPAGTVFTIKVLTKADANALRLHRCGEACKSAETVKLWQPGDYRVGDELTWRADREGTYYLWAQDPRDGRSLEATTHWFVGNRTRIAFDSGAVIEVWYSLP
jgi:hypothetical protein